MKVSLLAFASLAGAILLPGAAQAQMNMARGAASNGYDRPLVNPNSGANNVSLYDLDGDGKVDDWERDKVITRMLGEMDLNHDGRIDAKDRKLAKEKMKQQKVDRLAEIKKYDRNGDGKLDDAENAARLAEEARERARQKPSPAAAVLSQPMIGY